MSNVSSVIKQHNCNLLSTINVDYTIAEIKASVPLMVNVNNHVSFTKLMWSWITEVISIMALVMDDLNLGTIPQKFISPVTSRTKHKTFKTYNCITCNYNKKASTSP